MAAIPTDWGSGGKGTASDSKPNAADALRDVADDLAALKAAIVGINAKLDLDAGVTDTNYTALWTPATLKTTKA